MTMIYRLTILLLIFGCEGEYNTSELVWEQKADSTKTVLDAVLNKEWIEKQGKELINKAKQFYKDKLSDEKKKKIGKEQKIETH
tara:strand:- start:426 stop:677 length:252 start_codon:yes stop_codon:yes gene_type:complete